MKDGNLKDLSLFLLSKNKFLRTLVSYFLFFSWQEDICYKNINFSKTLDLPGRCQLEETPKQEGAIKGPLIAEPEAWNPNLRISHL